MHESSDLDLITRAQRGDHRAFRDLVVKYQHFAYTIAYRFVGSSMEAEDVTQEVFIKLWKNIGKYKSDSKLTTWLYRIVTNHCLDHLKSVTRKYQMKSIAVKNGLQIVDGATREKEVDDREMLHIITGLAKCLTPKQQSVFVLRDLEGLSVDEVCTILNIKPDAMKSNLFYARQKIREDLKKYYSESVKLFTS